MKHLILFVYCFIVCNILSAQDCQNSLLFKKGTQLRYRTYFPILETGAPVEITGIIFEVADTATIDNVLTATIIKKQSSVLNKNYKFQTETKLTCDGKNIRYPLSMYTPDTIYRCDVKNKAKDTGYAAAIRYLAKPFFVMPPEMTSGIKLEELIADQEMTQGASEAYTEYTSSGLPIHHPAVPAGTKEITKGTYKNFKVGGKQAVETAAGTFEGFKISCDFEVEINKFKIKRKAIFYYNNELGFIKSEIQVIKDMSTVFELAGVKK